MEMLKDVSIASGQAVDIIHFTETMTEHGFVMIVSPPLNLAIVDRKIDTFCQEVTELLNRLRNGQSHPTLWYQFIKRDDTGLCTNALWDQGRENFQ